jgi:hypothetical protein
MGQFSVEKPPRPGQFSVEINIAGALRKAMRPMDKETARSQSNAAVFRDFPPLDWGAAEALIVRPLSSPR